MIVKLISQELRSWTLIQHNGTMLHHYLSHFLIHYQLSLVTCYLLGGFTEGGAPVFSVCLDDLISQAVSQSASASAPPTPPPWQSLPDTLLGCSTALAFNGALLAVGGGGFMGSTVIYHYQPSSNSWVKAGELPTGRCACTCTVLPNGDLYVAGGFGTVQQRVDIASSIHIV